MSSQFPAIPDEPATRSGVPGPVDAHPGSAHGSPDHESRARAVAAAAGAGLAVVAGMAVLGVAAGYVWAALAPRAEMVMTGPGAAAIANAESTANFTADAIYCLVGLVGGLLTGVASYLLAVRRYGPLAMAGVLAGAIVAAFLARWTGQQSGLAEYHHLLATLSEGASLRGNLTMSSPAALWSWPLAACVGAGGLEVAAGWRADLAAARAVSLDQAAASPPHGQAQ